GEREEFPGRAGHIPGAGNLPIEDLFGDDGRLRPREELRDLLAAAGVEEGDTVVAYCHIGLRATAVILAARAAGFEAVLYDGSMNEWARDPGLPLARPGGGR
ncbi:MAG TPA: rhodanese-like domain-containing protein, partial [Longimicrobiales bacterium]|nr:rhodanese-like domain-containing protein [Longimicrobiales bacterium]